MILMKLGPGSVAQPAIRQGLGSGTAAAVAGGDCGAESPRRQRRGCAARRGAFRSLQAPGTTGRGPCREARAGQIRGPCTGPRKPRAGQMRRPQSWQEGSDGRPDGGRGGAWALCGAGAGGGLGVTVCLCMDAGVVRGGWGAGAGAICAALPAAGARAGPQSAGAAAVSGCRAVCRCMGGGAVYGGRGGGGSGRCESRASAGRQRGLGPRSPGAEETAGPRQTRGGPEPGLGLRGPERGLPPEAVPIGSRERPAAPRPSRGGGA